MSDLTRGNLVFGSLNSKRSRVSLDPCGEGGMGGRRAAAVARGKEDDEAKLEGNDEVARVLCGLWSQRGARERGETSDSGSA